MPSLMRQMINALLPKGPVWEPKEGGGYDLFLDGLASNADYVKTDLDELSEVRNPYTTTVLSDLEREYGFIPDQTNLTELTRRARVASRKYNRNRNGSLDHLQNALDAAGFDLLVHSNSPAVDPAIFLAQNFQMVAGGFNAYAGRADAFAGSLGGELLVNGDLFYQTSGYLAQAGGMYAGGANHYAGYFQNFTRTPVEYTIPTDPNDWPLVFFVGGEAARNSLGELTSIEQGFVQFALKEDLKRTILQIKPIHSWAGLIITFT